VRAFANLYRRIDSANSTRAKQAAMVEAFAGARGDPSTWGSAAWMVYFLAGGKPRQTVPTRLLWRMAVEGSGYPEWLCAESYGVVGDIAETLALLLPEGAGGEEVALDVWMRERLLPLPLLEEEERFSRLKRWVDELAADQRLAFFKLITGELRVGVSRLQAVKALSEVAGVEESRMAQRMIGYAQARRTPAPGDFAALIAPVTHAEAQALDAGRPYPFYLAQSWQRPVAEMQATLGPPSNWIVEWKFDGIRAQLLRRGEGWRLWSRGEELISDSYPDLEPLARALPGGTALDGELVVMVPPETEASAIRFRASRRSRAFNNGSAARSSAKRPCASCRSPSSPTISSSLTAATCAACRSTSAAPRSNALSKAHSPPPEASACRCA
jgi:DNA ligase 1